jgi:hypothetical protein
MGSTGFGAFGNYPGSSRGGYGGNGQNGAGNVGGSDSCPVEIEEIIMLEDVAMSEYYTANNSLPTPGDAIELSDTLVYGRLVIQSVSTGETIGNMPTRYNYLLPCIKRGMHYHGQVVSSGFRPVPFVTVNLHA